MSESIIAPTVGIAPCPNCGQLIYSNARNCRFCSATVDQEAATQGAALQARVNTACNQAKSLRNAAAVMWAFFLMGLLPFSPLGWGFTGLFVALPVWLVYWQLRFGRMNTKDVDYRRAKRDWLISVFIWLPAIALQLLGLVSASR